MAFRKLQCVFKARVKVAVAGDGGRSRAAVTSLAEHKSAAQQVSPVPTQNNALHTDSVLQTLMMKAASSLELLFDF